MGLSKPFIWTKLMNIALKTNKNESNKHIWQKRSCASLKNYAATIIISKQKKKILSNSIRPKVHMILLPVFQDCQPHLVQLIRRLILKPHNNVGRTWALHRHYDLGPSCATLADYVTVRYNEAEIWRVVPKSKTRGWDAMFPTVWRARMWMNSRISTPGWCDSFHSRCQRRREVRWAAASLLLGRSLRSPCGKQTVVP